MCVKSFSTEAAARALAPALADGAVVLSLQNGVANPAVIRRECPGAAGRRASPSTSGASGRRRTT